MLLAPCLMAAIQQTRAKEITVGAVQMSAETEWFRTVELGEKAACDKDGAKLLVANARGQVDVEAQMVDNLVARGVDAIVISALNSSSSVPALKRAVDSGVTLVNYNTMINSPIMTTFVGVDNAELGAQMGRYVVDYVKKNMDNKAKIALLTIPKYEVGRKRADGFKKEIAAEPGISIVGEQEGENPEPSANTLLTMLQAHPDTQLIWTANEGGMEGAISAKRTSGADIKIFGTDMSLQAADALLDSKSGLIAISTQDPYNIGYKAAESAIQKVKGEKVPDKTIVPLELYTADKPEAVKAYVEKYRALVSK